MKSRMRAVLSLFLNDFKCEIDSLEMDCCPQKGPGKNTSSMWNILYVGRVHSSPHCFHTAGMDEDDFFSLITEQIISFNLADSNTPSCACHIASDGAALVLSSRSPPCVGLNCQLAALGSVTASKPNMAKVLLCSFYLSLPCLGVVPVTEWCFTSERVNVPWHMLWSCKVTWCSFLFSGVQGGEDEAPTISTCDFWWSAPR